MNLDTQTTEQIKFIAKSPVSGAAYAAPGIGAISICRSASGFSTAGISSALS